MKLRNLYLLNTVIGLVFALGLLLMPSVMLNLFGMDYTRDAATLGQLIAVELVVGGLITLLARDVTDAKARSAINNSNMLAGVLGIVVALNATLTGVFGWFGWVILAVYVFVAVAFAYFQFFAPPD
jgi:ABC-type transport system involved in multi-copper enzyme maturation permease subunit